MREHHFTFSIIAFVLSLSALFIGVYSLNDTHLNINGFLGYVQQRGLDSASVLNNKFKIDKPSLYQLYNDLNNDQSNAGVKVFLDGLKKYPECFNDGDFEKIYESFYDGYFLIDRYYVFDEKSIFPEIIKRSHEVEKGVLYIKDKTPVKSEDADGKYTFQMSVANYTQDLRELYLLCLDLNTYKYELLYEHLILIDKNEHIFQATCSSMPFVGIFLSSMPEIM